MAYDSPILTDREALVRQFEKTRGVSMALAEPLSPEDWMLQSMPDTSPVKWNLAHTSWFFETFLLKVHAPAYREYHPKFGYLFNSYYNQIGKMHPRRDRGLLSRPSAKKIIEYREHVDAGVSELIATADDGLLEKLAPLMTLGFAHEEQHQELLLTDLKHGLYQNPLKPAVYDDQDRNGDMTPATLEWVCLEGGLCEIGSEQSGFAFDNERPRHKVYLQPFELANRPVTNGEYAEFVLAGGYENANFWLADAWEMLRERNWSGPLYWHRDGEAFCEYTLFGDKPINPSAPVCHLSYYEAAAYASWVGARLPTEFEWEAASKFAGRNGNFLKGGKPQRPRVATGDTRLLQMFGDVWEWTASPYVAYPGFAPPSGAIGEYNGKFMSGQMVLRGGSCATPEGHIRPGYRNFFPPQARWQFSGLRLARDC